LVFSPLVTLKAFVFDAVFQFEPAFRKVFDFLGVNWDPAVADFHKHAAGKYIASPGFNQVAQPLYSSSVGRLRHYEAEYAAISDWYQRIWIRRLTSH
jgi:hypothetical protein